MFPILIFLLLLNIGFISGLPVNWLRRIAEGHHFDDFENYLPKFGDLPKYQYSTDNKINPDEDILFKSHVNKTGNANITIVSSNDAKKIADDIIDVAEFFKEDNPSSSPPLNKTDVNTTNILTNLTSQHLEDNSTLLTTNFPKHLEEENSTLLNDTLRFPRQELDEENKDGGEEIDEPEKKDGEKENSPQIDESSEEEGNEVTNLLGSLLGSLSRPDGSIDLEAITSLLGSLSTQNPDGSYNFDGLTELLMGFFGGGGEGGGGSDIASFLGGLVGAILKGSAQNPPGGPKGIGLFTGKLVGGILPALSGPQPTQDPDSTAPPPQGSDSASFIGGLIKGILQSSGLGGLVNSSAGGSSSSSGSGGGSKGGGSKFQIFKAVFSMITSLFTASSGNKSM